MAPKMPRPELREDEREDALLLADVEREDAMRDVDQPDPPAWDFEGDPHGADEEQYRVAAAAPRRIPKYSDMLISYSTIPGKEI